MKPARFLAALPLLTLAIGAQTGATSRLPDRPAAALSMYKDKLFPVVGADGNAPIVIADGSQVTLGGRASIVLTSGDRYADGFVTIADLYTQDVPTTDDPETAAL